MSSPKCPCVFTEHLLTHFTASVSAEKGSSFVLNKICKFPFLKSLLFTIPIEIKKFGWVFDKVAIRGSNLKFAPSICKPQQQGPNPVQLTFNLENSKFLDLLPVQYLFYRELSGRLPGSHTLIIPSREYLLIFT